MTGIIDYNSCMHPNYKKSESFISLPNKGNLLDWPLKVVTCYQIFKNRGFFLRIKSTIYQIFTKFVKSNGIAINLAAPVFYVPGI